MGHAIQNRRAMPSKTDGPSGKVLTKHGPVEEEMTTHTTILAVRIPWTIQKGKKIWQQKMLTPSQKIPSMLLGKNGEQLIISPERMKWPSQSGNNTEFCMCPSGESKVWCCKEQYCIRTWKVLYSICQQIWKTQQWPPDSKRSIFIPVPKKGNAKECWIVTIFQIHHAYIPVSGFFTKYLLLVILMPFRVPYQSTHSLI